MKITLYADERLIEKARAAARARGTTLNELVRRFMEELAGEADGGKLATQFRESVLHGGGKSPAGWKIDRQQAHERGRGA